MSMRKGRGPRLGSSSEHSGKQGQGLVNQAILSFLPHPQAKRMKEEEERSKEQRRASLAASRRPSASAASGAASAAGEAATPSGAQQGMNAF